LLATIRFAEGTLGPDGYGTHFGGSYTPPGGAHPNKVIRKGGYASAAYGAYQFMPDTWRGVGGGNMTPARQDEAALRLARNRGVDPDQPLNRSMIDKLAPEWASFPTLKTGTSYHGQGGKSFAEIEKFYRQQVQKGGGDVASLDLEAGKARADAAEKMQQQLKAAESINTALRDQLAIAQTTEPVARQMLEHEIQKNELAKKYQELKEAAAGPDELILLNANLIIEQRIEQIEHEEKLNSLLAERAVLMANIAAQAAMPTVYNELETQEAALQAVLDKYPAIGAAADAASTLATSGVSEMIAGTKDAKEVFVDFLSSIADALMDTAKQMIAQYIAIGIARMFAGMGGSVATDAGGWATSFATPQAGIGTGFNFNAGAMTGGTPWSFAGGGLSFAGGGYTGNAPRAGGVDGQGGFPAILHPRETVIDHTRAISRQGAATMASAPVNVTVNVDASGNSQVSGDQNQGAQLGRVIAGAVQQELVRQKRPGGLLAS
jgi:muramidase (phage lysozyme)